MIVTLGFSGLVYMNKTRGIRSLSYFHSKRDVLKTQMRAVRKNLPRGRQLTTG